ncbi:MAG: DUF4132 domain-containing protein [Armatimonadota bacterium]
MKWLHNILSLGGFENPDGLSTLELSLLIVDFRKLNKLRPGLGDRALTYIVDGDCDTVLDELRKTQGCSDAMCFQCIHSGYGFGYFKAEIIGSCRNKLLNTINTDSDEFYARLARTYDATSSGSRYCRLSDYIPEWLEVILLEAVGCEHGWGRAKEKPPVPFKAAVVEKMLKGMGSDPDLLLRAAIQMNPEDQVFGCYHPMFTRLAGFEDYLGRYPETVVEYLKHRNYRFRVQALDLIARTLTSIDPFIDAVIDLAVSGSIQVRNAADELIKKHPHVLLPLVEEKLKSGNSEERGYAAACLRSIGGNEYAYVLEKQLQADTSDKAKMQIERALGRRSTAEKEVSISEIQDFGLTQIAPVDPYSPLPEEAVKALIDGMHDYNRQHKEVKASKKQSSWWQAKPISSHSIEQTTLIVQGKTPMHGSFAECEARRLDLGRGMSDYIRQRILEFLALPSVQLIHVFRIAVILGEGQRNYWTNIDMYIRHFTDSHKVRVELREIEAVALAMKIEPEFVARLRLLQPYIVYFLLDDDLTWPYFAENPGVLRSALGYDRTTDKRIPGNIEQRHRALDIVAMFPEVPNPLLSILWDIALGTKSKDRGLAMQILNKLPGVEKEIVLALKNGKQDARTSAAEWLTSLGYRESIPAIQAALSKEKQDVPAASMMNALEALGVPIQDILHGDDLLVAAKSGLKNGIPSGLSWFPFDSLPSVRWRESGDRIPEEVITWWIAQQNKIGSPDPSPLITRYCSLMRDDDRESLGRFILQQWIAYDTKVVYTPEEALRKAEKEVSNWAQQWPQHYGDPQQRNSAIQNLVRQYKSEFAGSAIKEKGVLAFVGACGGPAVVSLVEGYLKEWYGMRLSQCKAMVKMIANVDHTTAVQLLLSVANRFRTRSIQEEAEVCVKELAERKGWTIDELADRTVPTAKFDEKCEILFDYGSRTLAARLEAGHKIIIRDAEGVVLGRLPNARKDDDPELVKAAKAELSSVKKELKSVLKMQKARLYEAMCIQRSWRPEDWRMFLYSHPILRYYCQGLVWLISEERGTSTFRPLDDGTLTDAYDNEVVIMPDARIRLAHGCIVPNETRDAWIKHLADYEVEPPFEQFVKQDYELPEDKRMSTQLDDFHGYMIGGLKLRSKAEALGYIKSQAEDGGGFNEFQKVFSTLGMQAVIEFSGMYIAAEGQDNPVALINLHFMQTTPSTNMRSSDQGMLTLGEVPPVLLSECWNDMREIAEYGSGFDAEWEKKTDGW